MAYFVYRPASSTGARELAAALNGQRLRNYEPGRGFYRRFRSGRIRPVTLGAHDHVVMWGAHVTPGIPNALNNTPLRSKFSDITTLRAANVPTVEAVRVRPAPRTTTIQPPDPAFTLFQRVQEMANDFTNLTVVDDIVPRNPAFLRGTQDLSQTMSHLAAALAHPAPAPVVVPADTSEWLGRSNSHVGGDDLLTPPASPDFYVKKVNITQEFRVHSFLGRSLRAGVKQLREGWQVTGHPGQRASDWVRSWNGGWRIVYDGVTATQAVRDLAHNAVATLGLDFGAVDIGQLEDGSLIVLEVNRAPGVENGTVGSYVAAINRWAAGEWTLANRPALTRDARRAERRATRRTRRA